MTSTHAARLERWLGPEQCETISQSMAKWYGPPIAIRGVPGAVWAVKGGDFCGPLKGGGFASLADYATERLKRIERRIRERQNAKMSAGFSSLSDLISEATTGGKRQDWWYYKVGSGAVTGASWSLWELSGFPPAGSAPSAIPGGSVPTNATVGAIPFVNPGGGDTLHITTIQSQASTAPNTLLMYDRTFHASGVSATSTSAQAVSGTPTRYATTTSPGVFAFPEVTTTLGATASNLTMQYTDQAGNTAENAPAIAMTTSAAATGRRIPLGSAAPFGWFIPLNSADTGLRTITNLTLSASMTAGVFNIVMGKPLAWVPQPVANSMVVMDGINSAFSLVEVLTNACLAFIEMKGVGSSTTYTGTVTMVAG